MNYYKVLVRIESNEGTEMRLETHRNFTKDKDIYIFASGFADGFAMAHQGAVIEKQIEKLNDDRSLRGRDTV